MGRSGIVMCKASHVEACYLHGLPSCAAALQAAAGVWGASDCCHWATTGHSTSPLLQSCRCIGSQLARRSACSALRQRRWLCSYGASTLEHWPAASAAVRSVGCEERSGVVAVHSTSAACECQLRLVQGLLLLTGHCSGVQDHCDTDNVRQRVQPGCVHMLL